MLKKAVDVDNLKVKVGSRKAVQEAQKPICADDIVIAGIDETDGMVKLVHIAVVTVHEVYAAVTMSHSGVGVLYNLLCFARTLFTAKYMNHNI